MQRKAGSSSIAIAAGRLGCSGCRTWSLHVQWPCRPTVVASAVAVVFFGLGGFLGAGPSVDTEQQIALLRAEIDQLRKVQPAVATGTSGRMTVDTDPTRPDIHAREGPRCGGQAPTSERDGLAAPESPPRPAAELRRTLFARRPRSSSYGTAGYLGNGYFITVKHGVIALGQEGVADPRRGSPRSS